MCGIIAYLGKNPGIIKAYEGLLILKNRGYDSAGISSIVNNNNTNEFLLHKYASSDEHSAFDLLKDHLPEHNTSINLILHSRWAVVGKPTVINSHPHIDYTNTFSLIHNGIIENYSSLRDELINKGIKFKSDTDSEVIVNMIGYYYTLNNDTLKSIHKTLDRLEGTWGLVIQNVNDGEKLYCVRRGSPLVIGLGDDFIMISSE